MGVRSDGVADELMFASVNFLYAVFEKFRTYVVHLGVIHFRSD